MLMLFAFGLEKPSVLLVAAIVIIAIGTAVSGYGELLMRTASSSPRLTRRFRVRIGIIIWLDTN
jgi:hypothetical protein